MPNNPGVALVIVQHLDPTRKSLGPELLAKHTSMQLCEVKDDPQVRPNSVYVIPPGKYLSISEGSLHLSEPDQPRGARMAVDVFLRSLAKDMKHRGIGVILSGAGSDGTLGIKAIKECGGLAIVQDPQTAEHASMPQSAWIRALPITFLHPSKFPRRFSTTRATRTSASPRQVTKSATKRWKSHTSRQRMSLANSFL